MTAALQSGLDHLIALLEEAGYQIQGRTPEAIVLVLPVVHADSVVITYRIIITGNGSRLVAAEEPGSCILPHFCPERHIVGKGQFCMYWERERRFDVTDRASAQRWLGVLIEFLRAQRRAAYLRRWPSEEAWAHGEAAATAQREAERAGAGLQESWPELVLARQLEIRKELDGTFRVFLNGSALYSAWLAPNRRTKNNRRVVGACEVTKKGRRICKKQRRAQMFFNLASALWRWNRAEAYFWKFYSDQPCCGTMDTCGLKDTYGAKCND